MAELIKEKEIIKLWKKLGMDKEIDRQFKGKEKIEITKKELTDYTIGIVKSIANGIITQLIDELS